MAEIHMTGRFSLGAKDNPAYRPMEARQILASPEGFVWAMLLRGGIPVSGSDSAFWTPAALLPGPGVTWEAAGPDTTRVTVRHGGLAQAVDIAVDAAGCPVTVSFQRWSDASPEKRHRLQPFGGVLSDFREVEGFRLPFRVEAGNMFGTGDYFPFYLAEVGEIRFPGAGA